MTPTGWAKYLYLAHFAKPKCDRAIFRSIKKKRITKIVEVGLRDADFTLAVIQTAIKYSEDEKISYAGVDLFEARPSEQTSFSLKDMYKRLADKRVKVRLIPGDPMVGLSRFANTLADTQMLIISADVDSSAMQNAWYYVPRMLAAEAAVHVYRRSGQELAATVVSTIEVQQQANAASTSRRAAA